MSESNKRFLVALSFPGEHREFVAKVAQRLSRELGQSRVLYDKFHEAEFARPNLDTHLQALYHDESELVVVFLCADYERKEWPGLEWRAIRDLIKKKQATSIMLIRLDDANISGVFSIDGYISAEGRVPTDIAALIIDRLRILETERQPLSASRSFPPQGQEHASSTLGFEKKPKIPQPIRDAINRGVDWVVVPWGTTNTAELFNALLTANVAQDQFRFELHREALPLDAERYRLADGGLDLDRAAKDLMRRRNFKQLASANLVLVTAEPYSAPGAVGGEVKGVFLPGFFYETDVLGDGRVSIVSTFLWDHLPPRADLDVLAPSGRRAWPPYLLWALAIVVLDKLIDTEAHQEILACPNDYSHDVESIDAFFAQGRWLCEERCNPILRDGVARGRLHLEQWKAVKRILNRARGRPANGGFDSCFISYGRPDRVFARRLYRDLKARNIECWIYDEDSLPGDRTWRSIDDARKFAERILMICSSKSLARAGVKKELELQVDENRDKLIPISRDTEWLDEGFSVDRGLGNLVPFLRERNYADFVNRSYAEALERLVRALHWK